jgi:hypothetical protein
LFTHSEPSQASFSCFAICSTSTLLETS